MNPWTLDALAGGMRRRRNPRRGRCRGWLRWAIGTAAISAIGAGPAASQMPDGAALWLEARSLVIAGSPDPDRISTCHSSTCRADEAEDTPAAESFCDTPPATVAGAQGDCAAGCPRFWLDLGPNAGRQAVGGVAFDVGTDDAEKPCLVLGCLNGQACMRGRLALSGTPGDLWDTGAQQELQIVDIMTFAGDFHIIALLRQDPDQGAEDQCVAGDATHHLCVKPSGAVRLRLGGFDATISAAALDPGRFRLLEVWRSGSGIHAAVDSIDRTSGAPSSTTSLVVSNVMSFFKGSGAFAGDLALLAFYDRALTAAERRQVGLYAADQFGVGMYINRHGPLL